MRPRAQDFAQAYAQDQTVYAAAGDSGLTGCGGTEHGLRSTDDPASQPDVIGVGGTTIAGAHETVWNRGSGVGGGGVSLDAAMPAYQHAVLGDRKACGTDGKSFCRQVPDVSADADPYTGYVIYFDGKWQGGWGGTSAATPLWAAATALIDASPACRSTGRVANMLPTLYSLARNHSGASALVRRDERQQRAQGHAGLRHGERVRDAEGRDPGGCGLWARFVTV